MPDGGRYVWGGNTASSNASTLADMWQADGSTVLTTATAAAPGPVLRAYPNPSTAGTATLELPEDAEKVQVFDALGRLVRAHDGLRGMASYTLDVHGYPAGIYQVSVLTTTGASARCRLVCE